jgi:adenine-specific DNA-methyltransferase
MAKRTPKKKSPKQVESLTHSEASRKNIPTAEFQSVMRKEDQTPLRIAYERRNCDLDPQLVWRGKDLMDWSDLVVPVPPLYIQEKVHPKVLIDDLMRQTKEQEKAGHFQQIDLFADFNGLPDKGAKTEFYQHDANWTNRMILGDSLQVMASLAEREGLRGKVQCIYLDPPYGIKFNSNFQWSTTSRDVKDGKADHITREPEQVKAFRDTWRDGIHSYLTYLRDRLTVARDLLSESGSVFVQIGDENVHRVRALLDEVFGSENFVSCISFKTTSSQTSEFLPSVVNFIVWYARRRTSLKFRELYEEKEIGGVGSTKYNKVEYDNLDRQLLASVNEDRQYRVFRVDTLTSQSGGDESRLPVSFHGRENFPRRGGWKTNATGFGHLIRANRITIEGASIGYIRYLSDFAAFPRSNIWADYASVQSRSDPKVYVVQTATKVIQRCILMTTDPGDLVLDPTCGSGTTATVSEQWGRRWITIDTSRVALALARARIMGARYPYYLLTDSRDGQLKEAEITCTASSEAPPHDDIRQGFVYERIPHIMLRTIANNAEIDVIWEQYQEKLEPLLEQLSTVVSEEWRVNSRKTNHSSLATNHSLAEWEIPREFPKEWPAEAKPLHDEFWKTRIARQKEIDASIADKADYEYLYDKPYEDKKKVRVAGPFTVESLSPHRVLGVDENDELIDPLAAPSIEASDEAGFVEMILDNLKIAGVQQAHKEDKIEFTSLAPWPGHYICAEGRYIEGSEETGISKRAAIFIGPEFGTVSRPDLVAAAREAGDADFDVLIACAFNYDAHSSEFNSLGRIPVLKARMNADLHMAEDLKKTTKGNLFVIFGEPDIEILDAGEDGEIEQIRVKVHGVDVFDPSTGEVRSDSAEGIACWFIDTDYNEESFFVRQAYFLGASDPYKALKTTLKAEINEEAWETLHSDTSRPFDKPEFGRIAVKVINHLGDEVMKVFRVENGGEE